MKLPSGIEICGEMQGMEVGDSFYLCFLEPGHGGQHHGGFIIVPWESEQSGWRPKGGPRPAG